MFLTRVLASLFEFVLMIIMSGIIIYINYTTFIHANPDFDMEEEIIKGNVSVGILVAVILFSASIIIQKGLNSVVTLVRLRLLAPAEAGFSFLQLTLMCLGHMVLSLWMAVMIISITLRIFGRLVQPRMHAGKELEKGNVAVGILLASVVLVAAMYGSQGVEAVSRAMIPQLTIGHIQIQK